MLRLSASANRINTHRQVQLGLAEQPPPIWPLPYRPNMDGRIEALEAAMAGEAARYRQQQATSIISKPKNFKHIPVALINDITVPPRSACRVPVQCNCPVTLTNTDVQF